MRECRFCKKEKPIEDFVKHKTGRRSYCKQCHNEKYCPKKGCVRDSNSRWSSNSINWIRAVKERDGYRCKNCGTTEKLHAHHIVPWKEDFNLRFDIDNGETLCSTCHLREERKRDGLFPVSKETQFKKGDIPKNAIKKGSVPWNKGIKLKPEQIGGKETQFKKGQIAPNKGKKIEVSEESKKTQFKKGVSASPETQFKKGMIPWNKGLKRNEHDKTRNRQ